MTVDADREIVSAFARAAHRAREAGARRRRNPRLQRLPDHTVPQLRHQRPHRRIRRLARESRPVSARGRAGDPRRVGADYHLQFKISAEERQQRALPVAAERATTLEESIAGLPVAPGGRRRRIHVSAGSCLPASARTRPARSPAEDDRPDVRHHALERQVRHSGTTCCSGASRQPDTQVAVGACEQEASGRDQLPLARAVKAGRGVPVICAGGFQTASMIRQAIDGRRGRRSLDRRGR